MKVKVSSDLAILDVLEGRKELEALMEKGQAVQVVLRGTIRSAWGKCDGTSQEFQLDVEAVEMETAE